MCQEARRANRFATGNGNYMPELQRSDGSVPEILFHMRIRLAGSSSLKSGTESSDSSIRPRANITTSFTTWKATMEIEQPMPKTSKITADKIAEMATRGQDVTNKFAMIGPVRRVNVDLTQ